MLELKHKLFFSIASLVYSAYIYSYFLLMYNQKCCTCCKKNVKKESLFCFCSFIEALAATYLEQFSSVCFFNKSEKKQETDF